MADYSAPHERASGLPPASSAVHRTSSLARPGSPGLSQQPDWEPARYASAAEPELTMPVLFRVARLQLRMPRDPASTPLRPQRRPCALQSSATNSTPPRRSESVFGGGVNENEFAAVKGADYCCDPRGSDRSLEFRLN